ncbi:hypothetical protein AVEN_152370-1 [Araneus ventricosus]|uniref:CCHC-type domain-containing protein n=1 Tax=Araneus ventricosus TaxID=182803 RepID=A0A4Y2DB47_ARAVE|nr:hypothetical protein AVEN_152370-1 [Araneus ventricosus]
MVNFSIKSDYGGNWITSVEPDIYAGIKKGKGLFFEWGFHRIDDFHSARYCTKCGSVGHSEAKCIETPKCYKCGDNLIPSTCNKIECIGCKDNNLKFDKKDTIDHLSRDRKCPIFVEAINRVIINTDYGVS